MSAAGYCYPKITKRKAVPPNSGAALIGAASEIFAASGVFYQKWKNPKGAGSRLGATGTFFDNQGRIKGASAGISAAGAFLLFVLGFLSIFEQKNAGGVWPAPVIKKFIAGGLRIEFFKVALSRSSPSAPYAT